MAIGHTLVGNWDALTAATGDRTAAIESVALHGSSGGAAHPFSRSQVYVAAGMVAVQLAVPVDEGLDRLRAYSYATGQSLSVVANDVVTRRVSLASHREGDQDG